MAVGATATARGFGSFRSRELANETGLKLVVCHFPPGTWNKIEHRLFSYITQNWQGEPLATLQTIVELIGSTTTKGGLVRQALPKADGDQSDGRGTGRRKTGARNTRLMELHNQTPK